MLGAPRSRETVIGVVVTGLALVAMVFDHLLGEDPGLEDPVAFLIAAALTLAAAGIVFGLVVPRAKADPNPGARAAKHGFVLSLVSVLSITLIWLGVTFVIAGGAIALGLLGRRSERPRMAVAAIVIGAIVLGLSTVFSDWTSST
jgi:peptidoglycan/LPS O-acetylase OafA/YrhL